MRLGDYVGTLDDETADELEIIINDRRDEAYRERADEIADALDTE